MSLLDLKFHSECPSPGGDTLKREKDASCRHSRDPSMKFVAEIRPSAEVRRRE